MLNEEKSASGGEEQNNQNQAPPTEHKSSNLKSKLPWIIIIVLLVLVGIFGGYFVLNQTKKSAVAPTPTPQDNGKPCTQEAKICPDGSGVGRTGPNCEFAPCPIAESTPVISTDDWQTYTDSDFRISIMYPKSYGNITVKESPPGKLLNSSINKAFVFGAYIKPDEELGGRGGSLYDLYKFSNESGKYYWSMWFDPSVKQSLEPVKVLKSRDGSEILILNNNSFVETRGGEYKYLGDGDTAAFINLKGSKYTSLVFINSPFTNGQTATPIPQPEFEALLQTLEIK